MSASDIFHPNFPGVVSSTFFARIAAPQPRLADTPGFDKNVRLDRHLLHRLVMALGRRCSESSTPRARFFEKMDRS